MSYVSVDSYKLRQLCIAVVKRCQQERSTARRKVAEDRAKEINEGWWHKKLKRNDVTIEQLLEHIKKNHSIYDFEWVKTKWIGQHPEEIAEKLLASTRVSGRVNVSSEDMQYLVGWSPDGMVKELFGERGYR